MPRPLRLYASVAGYATRLMIPHPDRVVISTFHHARLGAISDRITFTGGLLRKAVEDTPAGNDGFLLVYVRPSISDSTSTPGMSSAPD